MARREAIERVEREILQEKAEALGRVGERLADLLVRLRDLGRRIDEFEAALAGGGGGLDEYTRLGDDVERFNRLREMAVRLAHDLVVQREAVGFRRHALILETYPIPPRRVLSVPSPTPAERR